MAPTPSADSKNPPRGTSTHLAERLGTRAQKELNTPMCFTCSTQTSYTGKDLQVDSDDSAYKCRICADPRQFIGLTGQTWTTLSKLHADSEKGYYNDIENLIPNKLWTFKTRPQFGIGQRAFLIQDDTVDGLVMWDCVAYIDDAILAFIDEISHGKGIKHLVVSHPHYYSTTAVWAAIYPGLTFWLPRNDFNDWYIREDVIAAKNHPRSSSGLDGESIAYDVAQRLQLVDDVKTPILGTNGKFTIFQLGGHFPGSLVLLYEDILFIADTIQVVPSGIYNSEEKQREGVTTFSFLWSYPNQIPLSASEISNVCAPLEDVHFDKAFGAFENFNVWGHAKEKVFQSRDIILTRLAAEAK